MLTALETRDISTFIVQHGSYRPAALDDGKGSSRALNIDAFAYADDLDARMRKVDLVISHAGSGSILNALRGSPFIDALQHALPLVIVPNASLMDDHQSELAKELDASGLAVVASAHPTSLAEAIRKVCSTTRPASLPKPRARLVDLLDEELGL